MSDVHDMAYYQKCMVGGILSCGITHALVTPLDIVKCRMQVSNKLLHMTFTWGSFSWWNATICLTFFLCDYRLTQECTRVLEMDSNRLKLRKVLEDLLLDGCQPSSDTLLKVSESSVSMKSSRMFTEQPLVRTSQSTEPLVSLSLLLALRSSLMSFSAHGKP